MEWARMHPYLAALCAAGALIIIGAFTVASRAVSPAGTQARAWGGGAVPLLNPTSYGPTQNPTQGGISPLQQAQDDSPYTYIAPSLTTSAQTDGESSYDFEAFIALLSQGSAPKKTTGASGDDILLNAYAYIPRGLISTTTPSNARTELQQSLYDYGNDIGSTIESFEQQHSNIVQVMKGQVEDRADPDKAAAVVNIGRALEELGKNLSAMDSVPPAIDSAHQALAKSYAEMGKSLILVPKAERDADFIQAIQTYNASADTFTKNYIQLVSLFGAHGVSFTSSDPGSIFTFSQSGF